MKRTFTKYPQGYIRASSEDTALSFKWKIGDYVYCEGDLENGSSWGTVVGFKDGRVLVSLEDYDNEVGMIKPSRIYKSPDEAYNKWREGWEEYREKYPGRPLW
jgi:hypothetical protein